MHIDTSLDRDASRPRVAQPAQADPAAPAVGTADQNDGTRRRDLVDKSVTNIFWTYVSFFCTKVLNLIALVVLARFLPPAEFGLMAFSIVIIGYFETFSRFGPRRGGGLGA